MHSEETDSPGRLLGIDLGDKRVGLAISDPTGHFAIGLETIIRTRHMNLCDEIKLLCQKHGISAVIIGLPISMNGTAGSQAEKVRAFAEELQAFLQLPLHFMDERLTSVMAQQTLRAQGIQPSRQKHLIDQASAQRILQDFMDRRTYLNKN